MDSYKFCNWRESNNFENILVIKFFLIETYLVSLELNRPEAPTSKYKHILKTTSYNSKEIMFVHVYIMFSSRSSYQRTICFRESVSGNTQIFTNTVKYMRLMCTVHRIHLWTQDDIYFILNKHKYRNIIQRNINVKSHEQYKLYDVLIHCSM